MEIEDRLTLADLKALQDDLGKLGLTKCEAAEMARFFSVLHLPRMQRQDFVWLAYGVYMSKDDKHKRDQLKLLFDEAQQAKIQAPPRLAHFALLLIPKRNREHLIGDLEEEFRTVVLPQYGRFLARCWYFEQVALAVGCYAWPTIKKILGLSVIFKLIGR